MKKINENKMIDYSKFNNILLSDIHYFFSKKVWEELTNLGINNLGDLLEKEHSGELIYIFFQKHKEAYELWNYICGALLVLKCEYLNVNPQIDFNDKYDFAYKLGFRRSIRKRILCYSKLQLPSLLTMINNNDYHLLYEHFSQEVVLEIVSKIKVINDYLKRNKQEPTLDDLKMLYAKLASLINEHERISNEIAIIQNEIKEKTKYRGTK